MRKQINFNAKVTPIKPLNDEFTLCRCYVMALEKNRNLTYISKETAEAALPTLFNVPVIGHLWEDEDGNYHMGGHDMTIEEGKDGEWRFKSVCIPFGVVPQQEDIHYEDIAEPNGDVHTYLVADVILWTGRYPELKDAIYAEDVYFGQSMEINVADYEPLEEDKNYTNILGYSYSALCLLGKSDDPDYHVEPCFPMASVEPYEFSLEDAKFSALMQNMKDDLAKCFSTDPAPEETEEPAPESAEPVEEPEAKSVYSFGEDRLAAICAALPAEDDGVWRVCDFDDEFVYVKHIYRVGEETATEYGRQAYAYDAEAGRAVLGAFESVSIAWKNAGDIAAEAAHKAEFDALVDYKADRERRDHETAIDAAIAEFSDLEGNEEYAEIAEKRYSYETVDALRNACYIVRGKSAAPQPRAKFSTGENSVNIHPAEKPMTARDRLHARYGNK